MTPWSGVAEVGYSTLPRLQRILPERAGKTAPEQPRKDGIANCVFFPYPRLSGWNLAGSREPKAMAAGANSIALW